MINSYLLLFDNAINNKQAALTPANAIWADTYRALPTGYGHHVHGILDALVHPLQKSMWWFGKIPMIKIANHNSGLVCEKSRTPNKYGN